MTKRSVIAFTRPAADRGAQCPRCFTFNLFDYFRAKVAEARGEASPGEAGRLKCALCGFAYTATPSSARAA